MPTIPVAQIIAFENYRDSQQGFKHVIGLAKAIKQDGQENAIKVRPITPQDRTLAEQSNEIEIVGDVWVFTFSIGQNTWSIETTPKYVIKDGESRWRAHILNKSATIKADIVTEGNNKQSDRNRATLSANCARANTNYVEDSRMVWRTVNAAILEHETEIGRKLAQSERDELQTTELEKIRISCNWNRLQLDWRVSIAKLAPEYVDLIGKGQLGIKYAYELRRLNHSYQRVAMRRLLSLTSKGERSVAWFKLQIKELETEQNSPSLFAWGAVTPKKETAEKEVTLPPDPFQHEPPSILADVLKSEQQKWSQAAIDWNRLGNKAKTKMSSTLAKQYGAMLQMLAKMQAQATVTITRKESYHDSIVRLLNKHGEIPLSRLQAYANAKKQDIAPVLEELLADGSVIGRNRKGEQVTQIKRGVRYSVPSQP